MRGWLAWAAAAGMGVLALVLWLSPGRLLVAAVAVAVVATAASAWRARVRGGRLAAWAAGTGWAYLPEDPSLLNISFRYPFGTGERRWTAEVLRGTFSGHEAVSFVYAFQRQVGRGQATSRFHVVALRLPQCLPVVEVVPERAAERTESALGGQDLRFESEAFNRAYRVQARDERAAYAIVQPLLMERLLRDDAREIAWRIDGDWVLSWRPGVTDLDTLAARLSVLSAVVASVPQFVWQDYGYGPFPDPDR
ncbi:MAG TPA: hypothetical protein VGC04_15045 [Cellulomonas sp.]